MASLLPLLAVTGAAPTATVYLMRHCARATYLPDMYGGQEPRFLANYSNGGDLPDWGVAPTLCTARGRKIVQGEGRSLRGEFAERLRNEALKVIYDAGSMRDNTTALDFLTGLGLPTNVRDGEGEVFTPTWAGCPEVSANATMEAVREQLASVPKPLNYLARIAALQKLLGKGVAPEMEKIPDTVAGGPVGWLGGSFAASSWIEAMLLQFGAGLPIAYDRVTPEYLYELLELHVYYRAVSDRGFAIEQRGQSNLLAHMLRDLQQAEGGTSLYVGHDTNLDGIAVMLGLAWPHAPPFPANTTVPGSILRLTASGGTVSAAYLYTDFKNDTGAMAEVDAIFSNGKSSMPLASLSSYADGRIDKRCVRLESVEADL